MRYRHKAVPTIDGIKVVDIGEICSPFMLLKMENFFYGSCISIDGQTLQNTTDDEIKINVKVF